MKLYIYDHCPYCVRARMPFGFKSIGFELKVLLNDDEATPVRMIGKKMVPILEKDDGSYLPESLDIVAYVDGQSGPPALAAATGRTDLDEWRASLGPLLYSLTMPRWVQAPLAEYATAAARAYFTTRKEASIGSFQAHLANTAALKAEMSTALKRLAPLIQKPDAVSGVLSYDDIVTFGHLRGLTIVKNLDCPAPVRAYLEAMSAKSGVPLYDDIAID